MPTIEVEQQSSLPLNQYQSLGAGQSIRATRSDRGAASAADIARHLWLSQALVFVPLCL
jgi:hypothetical protein